MEGSVRSEMLLNDTGFTSIKSLFNILFAYEGEQRLLRVSVRID